MSSSLLPQAADSIKIQVLLAEYGALRQVMVSRSRTRFGVLGLVLALLAYISVPHPINETFRYILGMALVAIFVAVWGRFGWIMIRCAIRIIQIEKKVNSLVGEELLVWHDRWARKSLLRYIVQLLEDEEKKQ